MITTYNAVDQLEIAGFVFNNATGNWYHAAKCVLIRPNDTGTTFYVYQRGVRRYWGHGLHSIAINAIKLTEK